MAEFIVGMILGGLCGIVAVCVVAINPHED